jgi:hypothetical protein
VGSLDCRKHFTLFVSLSHGLFVYIETGPGYREHFLDTVIPSIAPRIQMDPSKPMVSSTLDEAKYIEFPSLPADAKHEDGSPALNRYSATITRGHDFPGAQVRRKQYYLDVCQLEANAPS